MRIRLERIGNLKFPWISDKPPKKEEQNARSGEEPYLDSFCGLAALVEGGGGVWGEELLFIAGSDRVGRAVAALSTAA